MKKEAWDIRVWTLYMELDKLIILFYSFFWDNITTWLLHHLKILGEVVWKIIDLHGVSGSYKSFLNNYESDKNSYSKKAFTP